MARGVTTLGQIINALRRGEDMLADDYVYAEYDLGKVRDPDTTVFVDEVPSFDAQGESIMPDRVQALGLWIFCSAELMRTVVQHALKCRPSVSNAQIVQALDYYMEADDFMDL